jgi:hypothetical protein
VGPLGHLLWAHDSQYFLNWDGHDNYVLRRLTPPVRPGECIDYVVVLASGTSVICCDLTRKTITQRADEMIEQAGNCCGT